MIEAPPAYVIEHARISANESPCAKSKRGVVLFNREHADRYERHPELPRGSYLADFVLISFGFNGPPAPFECKGTAACRGSCADVCLHAEQRAIIAALGCDDVRDLELVHVKVVDGQVVAGGGPSCLQCSKLVAEVGLRGVWLFEAQRWHYEARCQACSQITIIEQHGATTGVCERCDHVGRLLGAGKTAYAPDSGVWRFYRADVFHEATLASNGISSLGAGG